jgi:hypothetical protein
MKKTIYSALFAAAMLFATSSVFAQVKIGTNPTQMSPAANLEIQASTPGRLLRVDKTTGQVAIVDGTQGEGKIYTSDANGRGSWQTVEEANTSNVVIRAYNSATLVPTGTTYTPPVPLITGSAASNYDASNGEFTIPVSGFYNYNLSCEVLGTLGETFTVAVRNFDTEEGPIRTSSTFYNPRLISGTKFFPAGQVISFTFVRAASVPFDNNWRIRNVSIVIQKI